jgi:MFS transporter, DHA1 family, tetracycline resistance protein
MSARKPALVFIFITLFLDVLGIGLIVPILPKLIEDFEGGDVARAAGTAGLLMALYSLMQFLFSPLIGSLSDRFGRRPVILASLLGSGLDYILLALAPSLSWFVIGRIISGFMGASFTAGAAYIADVSPPEKRAQSMGIIGAAFGLGFIAGPAIGGLLGHYGLRVPFWVAAALTLVNWLYGLFVLPESLQPENRRAFSWSRANPLGALAALRQYPVVLGLAGVWFLLSLAHQVLPSTWVLYTGHRWGTRETGLSLALVGVMAAVVQGGLTRRIIPWLGERRAVIYGILIGAAGFIGYGLATSGWMIYVIIVLASVAGIQNPAVQGIISNSVAANEQGAVQGALTSLASVAGILGPPLVTGMFGYFISPQAPANLPGAAFFLCALLQLLALVLAVRSFAKSKA